MMEVMQMPEYKDIDIVFVRDAEAYEIGPGTPSYVRGQEVTLPEPSAYRWIRRGAAKLKSDIASGADGAEGIAGRESAESAESAESVGEKRSPGRPRKQAR